MIEGNNQIKPSDIVDISLDVGVAKSGKTVGTLLILGVLAGAFIAFAAAGSNMAAFNLLANPETYGLGKLIAGLTFPTGLILTVLTGAELFTGNTLMTTAFFEKRITFIKLMRNWAIVYLANLAGSFIIAWALWYSDMFDAGNSLLGGVTIKIAATKTGFVFGKAVVLGVLCNWLVCLALWLSYGSKSITGKILGIFLPISLFVLSGYEHVVANMYYIPAGILAKSNETMVMLSGLSKEALEGLNWGTFVTGNLIPVTIGNLIGGALMVGMMYWLAFKKFDKSLGKI